MDDRELVVAFKAGEPGAYDEMYRRYSARVGRSAGACSSIRTTPRRPSRRLS
jgi:hypothetical protein